MPNVMKIAVVVSDLQPTSGGAHTFEESLRAALLALAPENLTLVFYPQDTLMQPAEVTRSRAIGQVSRLWQWACKKVGLVSRQEFERWKKGVESEALRNPAGWNTDNPLNKAVVADGCHFVYFLTPNMVPVELPFIVTHWDLGHRVLPIFPELTLTGWPWGAREWYYTHWLQRATLILTGTNTGKKELREAFGIREESIVVNPFFVPSWVKNTQPQIPEGFGSPGPFLYYPAQFWPHKNHIVLLEALRILKDEGMELTLVLSGSDKGNKGYILEKVREYGLERQVRLLGFITRESLLWLYQNTSLMVFPCLLGPDNLPPLEALAAGAPVAVGDIDGAREYLPEGSVTYFNPRDERGLADLVRATLQEPPERSPRAWALPTAEDYAKKTLSHLQNLTSFRRCWGHGYRYL